MHTAGTAPEPVYCMPVWMFGRQGANELVCPVVFYRLVSTTLDDFKLPAPERKVAPSPSFIRARLV